MIDIVVSIVYFFSLRRRWPTYSASEVGRSAPSSTNVRLARDLHAAARADGDSAVVDARSARVPAPDHDRGAASRTGGVHRATSVPSRT